MEEIGEISLSLTKHGGLLGTKRWSGSASAKWGFVSGGYRYRTRRMIRRSLLRHMFSRRPEQGRDVQRTISDGAKGDRSFKNRDLAMIQFPGVDLRRSDFSNTNLYEANLCEANLQGANFTCARLSGTDLERADFSNSILTGAAFFDSYLSGARFISASHQGTVPAPPDDPKIPMEAWVGWLYFLDCDLSNCVFDDANLPNVFFKRCDLSGTTFRNANLEGARILDCDVNGAVFDGANLERTHVGTPREDEYDDQLFP